MRKLALTPFLLLCALPAAAAYDVKGIALGAAEREIKRQFPSAHCKALEWPSRAADRRCDDSRLAFGGVEVQVTFYLKKDALEAFDLRFNTKELERFVSFLKSRYGAPQSESRDTIERKGKASRQVYKALWETAGQRAVVSAQLEKRRASLLVSRGDFEEEIYRLR
jgi:hypothetical protein